MEKENCWLCCDTIEFYAVGSCGHNDMCLKCSCRLRVLHGDTKCPICKEQLARILITANPEQRLEEFPAISNNNAYGFICADEAAQKAFDRIVSFNCWLCRNRRGPPFKTQHQLRKHIEHQHKKIFCNICLKSRTVFIWEQLLLKRNELEQHFAYGYQREIPHHPVCLFCNNRRFFDEAELRSHLESSHYFCNLCEIEQARNLYYLDYETLQTHFQKQHFVCHHEMCKSNRFVVFKTEFDLQMHLQNVHSNTVKGKITLQIGPTGGREELQNTEAVDFTSQFYPEKPVEQQEEHKGRPRQGPGKGRYRAKKLQIVNYKTLPSRPAPAVISDLKEALENNMDLFNSLKIATIKYNTSKISADELFETFVALFGTRTENLFPSMITTLNDPEKQEELHKKYVTYIETKNNVSVEGKCNNGFVECHTDFSIIKAMRDLFYEELTSRKAIDPKQVFYIDEEHLRQLAAMIDKLESSQMVKLSLVMNFRVTDTTRKLVLEMISRANDVEFARSIGKKYEKHFVDQIETQQLYVLYKYTSMAIAKLKGLPFKDEPQYVTNWKDEEINEEESQSGWSEAILGKKQKLPSYSVEEFPSLSTATQSNAAKAPPPPSQNQGKWAKFQPEPPKQAPVLNFPSLGQAAPAPDRNWRRTNLKEEEKKEPAKKQAFSKGDFPDLG